MCRLKDGARKLREAKSNNNEDLRGPPVQYSTVRRALISLLGTGGWWCRTVVRSSCLSGPVEYYYHCLLSWLGLSAVHVSFGSSRLNTGTFLDLVELSTFLESGKARATTQNPR